MTKFPSSSAYTLQAVHAASGISAALDQHRARVGALHELVNRQATIASAALAARNGGTVSAVNALQNLVGPTARIRAALDAGGSLGAVSAVLDQHRARVGAALAPGPISHALQNLVGPTARIRAALDAGGSLGAVSAVLDQHRARIGAIHQLVDLDTEGAYLRAAPEGRGVSTVIRPFVSTEPVPIELSHDNSENEDVPNLQRFGSVGDIDAFLARTLGMLNPAFPRQFRGSMQRSQERGPDWWTQAAASDRKLFLGVLHAAAPNDLVMPWVTSPKRQLDEHGRPTRRTKIAWLCRSIPNDSYRKFLLTELDSALALIELFNTAVHVDEFPEFEATFSWTQLRLKFAIRHILEIWLKWS